MTGMTKAQSAVDEAQQVSRRRMLAWLTGIGFAGSAVISAISVQRIRFASVRGQPSSSFITKRFSFMMLRRTRKMAQATHTPSASHSKLPMRKS